MAKWSASNGRQRGRAQARGLPVILLGAVSALASGVVFFGASSWTAVVYDPHEPQAQKDGSVVAVDAATTSPSVTIATTTGPAFDAPAYVALPDAVKGIYMSQCVVGTPSFREDLVELVRETELNSIVIDIKDYTGKIAFDTENPELAHAVSDQCGARDIKEFIASLHAEGIFVIGRITVFQDPYYSQKHPELAVKFATPPGTVWKDHKGLSFIDVGAKPYWDYIIALSREARLLGFDELNYDYIRFPSDGPMSNIAFDWAGTKPKPEALEEFFAYLSTEMKDATKYPEGVSPPVISADLFGMTTTNFDDLNIGQVLERALPYFDYVCPMVYPSHYPKTFNGWANPNSVPYELIHFVLESAVRRTVADSSTIHTLVSSPLYETVVVPPTSGASSTTLGAGTATTTKEVATGRFSKEVYDKDKIRPWLQDFDYGGDYDVAEVKAQIQATYDVGLDSWLLWAPSNRYTRGALTEG